MGTNFFLSIFMIGMLQYMWGLINTLQMIVMTALFSLKKPLNCHQIMIAIMKLTNLDVIPTEDFLNKIFTFEVEAPAFNENFEDAGYESSNFIIELGPLGIIIVLSTLLFIIKRLLKNLSGRCDDNWFKRRLQKEPRTQLLITRFLMESCVEIGLVSSISVVTVEKDRFNHFQDGLATVLAFIAIVCLGLTPFYLLYVNR